MFMFLLNVHKYNGRNMKRHVVLWRVLNNYLDLIEQSMNLISFVLFLGFSFSFNVYTYSKLGCPQWKRKIFRMYNWRNHWNFHYLDSVRCNYRYLSVGMGFLHFWNYWLDVVHSMVASYLRHSEWTPQDIFKRIAIYKWGNKSNGEKDKGVLVYFMFMFDVFLKNILKYIRLARK